MKQIKFKGKVNGKVVKGNWYCGYRPNNAKKIAENLIGHRIDNFVSVCIDIKDKMIKCEME